jgi:hypothetical protein
LRAWGRISFAWPRDGRRETLEGAGVALAEQYKAQGLEMLNEHAQFSDGSVSVEAGLMEMLSRMETGRSPRAGESRRFRTAVRRILGLFAADQSV